MRTQSAVPAATSIPNRRTVVPDEEQLFSSILADVARLLWPTKTAENLAALVGCSDRAIKFYLAGDREWSSDALAAIVAEILRRHSMRNVKIVARK